MSILSDEKVLARLIALEHLREFLESEKTSPTDWEDLDEVEDRTKNINEVVHQAAIPWLRGGDDRASAVAIMSWATIYTKMIDIIISQRALIERGGERTSDTEKREIVSKVWNLYQNVYVESALSIVGVAWKKQDVSPSYAVTLMSQQQIPGRYPTTLSPGMSRSLDSEMRGQG